MNMHDNYRITLHNYASKSSTVTGMVASILAVPHRFLSIRLMFFIMTIIISYFDDKNV